ncbi:MAG TPA: class I SAM-dependent methyltransferase [Ramlibacter sp.]|nr:class I SAM-dependent methyltransferase [Ramlibacter sp.]
MSSFPHLKSVLCTEATLMRPDLQDWAERLKEKRGHLHHKVWEWCYICQALDERGMLRPGRRGLGFAVGQEPLTALFASRGARIVATDLYSGDAAAKGWIETSQHAEGYASINKRGICDEAGLRERVQFRFADMNALDPGLFSGFDFAWSSCAFEHLGSLEHGRRFVLNAMKCLRPGGVAVHTTEFNVSSNKDTVSAGETVLYRRRDIDALVKLVRAAGHRIDIEYDVGNSVADGTVDVPPYTHDKHLKLQIGSYVATSIGLIITKGDAPSGSRLASFFRRWRTG